MILKKWKNAGVYALIMFLVILLGFVSHNARSLLTNKFTIQSSGYIENIQNAVYAASGSPSDIQSAVNSIATTGGIVRIPPGTYNWTGETVTIPGGVSVVGASDAGCKGHSDNWESYIASTVLSQNNPAPFGTMFHVDGTNGKRTRISGIRFEGNVISSNDRVSGTAITIDAAIDFRVDHCTFVDFPSSAISAQNTIYGTIRGVVDHNIFDNPYKDVYGGVWGYGIIVWGQANTWHTNITDFLGKYETAPNGFPIVYIEDNAFSRDRHCIASTQSGWYVARYNVITEQRPKNYGSIDIHGADSSTPGGRGLEAYNNTIVGSSGYSSAQAFWIRGGGGVICHNTMQNIWQGVGLYADNPNPAYQVNNLYIWDNMMINSTSNSILINNAAGYDENVNYFLRAPNQLQDEFIYTPYPYPHPLTLNG